MAWKLQKESCATRAAHESPCEAPAWCCASMLIYKKLIYTNHTAKWQQFVGKQSERDPADSPEN